MAVIHNFDHFRANHFDGAPLPWELDLGMTCRNVECALLDIAKLIDSAQTKGDAAILFDRLLSYEIKITQLVTRVLHKAESFDMDTKGAA